MLRSDMAYLLKNLHSPVQAVSIPELYFFRKHLRFVYPDMLSPLIPGKYRSDFSFLQETPSSLSPDQHNTYQQKQKFLIPPLKILLCSIDGLRIQHFLPELSAISPQLLPEAYPNISFLFSYTKQLPSTQSIPPPEPRPETHNPISYPCLFPSKAHQYGISPPQWTGQTRF